MSVIAQRLRQACELSPSGFTFELYRIIRAAIRKRPGRKAHRATPNSDSEELPDEEEDNHTAFSVQRLEVEDYVCKLLSGIRVEIDERKRELKESSAMEDQEEPVALQDKEPGRPLTLKELQRLAAACWRFLSWCWEAPYIIPSFLLKEDYARREEERAKILSLAVLYLAESDTREGVACASAIRRILDAFNARGKLSDRPQLIQALAEAVMEGLRMPSRYPEARTHYETILRDLAYAGAEATEATALSLLSRVLLPLPDDVPIEQGAFDQAGSASLLSITASSSSSSLFISPSAPSPDWRDREAALKALDIIADQRLLRLDAQSRREKKQRRGDDETERAHVKKDELKIRSLEGFAPVALFPFILFLFPLSFLHLLLGPACRRLCCLT